MGTAAQVHDPCHDFLGQHSTTLDASGIQAMIS